MLQGLNEDRRETNKSSSTLFASPIAPPLALLCGSVLGVQATTK